MIVDKKDENQLKQMTTRWPLAISDNEVEVVNDDDEMSRRQEPAKAEQ